MILIILVLLVVLFIAYKLYNPSHGLIAGQIPVNEVINHWSKFFNFFSMSSDVFYKELENVLKEHEMPHSTISRTKHKEGGMLSASREYLRIKHGDLVFDVCAAPFGKDFFISWWMYETESKVRTVFKYTKFGSYLAARAARRTFYQADEEEMFTKCSHQCLMETVEKVGDGKAFLQLSDADKIYRTGGM